MLLPAYSPPPSFTVRPHPALPRMLQPSTRGAAPPRHSTPPAPLRLTWQASSSAPPAHRGPRCGPYTHAVPALLTAQVWRQLCRAGAALSYASTH